MWPERIPAPAGDAGADTGRRTGILTSLRRLGSNERGAMAVLIAVLFPIVAGILGLAIETGMWLGVKRHNQAIADVAAYSGALEIASACTSCSGAVATAKADAKNNGFDFTDSANLASTVTTSGTTVTVNLKHDKTPLFIRYFLGTTPFTIANKAVASVESTTACASSVATGGTALSLNGSPTVNMPGCTITSNSNSASSISLSGSSVIDAWSIYTVGGISGKGSSTLNLSVPATTGGSKLTDPYAAVSVPSSVTGFTMPTLPSAATTFATLPTTPSAPGNTKSDNPASQTQPSGCDTSTTNITDLSGNTTCYTAAGGVTLNLQQNGNKNQFKANKVYYFSGPVSLNSTAVVNSSVDIYVAGGNFTITNAGTMSFVANGGKRNGNNAGQTVYVNNGSFDASAGTLTFTGDTSGTSAYALRVGGGGTAKVGTATFGGGTYSFYGGGVTLGASNHTTTLGAADYYIDTGGLTVNSGGTAAVTTTAANSKTTKTTNLTINGGSLTSNGTLSFNSSNVTGVTYALQVPSGGSYALSGGTATFGGNSTTNTKYGLYGGGLTVSSGVNVGINAGVNFYLDSGSLAVNGCAALQGGTSTINVNAGNLTSASTGSLTFNPNGTVCGTSYTSASSQFNINTGGSGHGVALSGPATFNAATYYFRNSNSSGSGVAVNGGTTTLAAGIYSIENGGFSVASGATLSAAQATAPCAPTGGSAGSCLYVANGGISNAGTATFATGNYYLYDPNGSGTSFSNSGTMTLGTSGSNNFYINNAGGAFLNTGALSFGAGNYYLWNNNSAKNANDSGGFASTGIGAGKSLTFTGTGSTYSFYNKPPSSGQPGPSGGTGNNSGACATSSSTYGALSIGPGTTTNLSPANYYVVNGDLCIGQKNGTAPTLTCSSCAPGGAGLTFIMTGSTSSGSYANNVSTLQIPDAITTNLNAPNGKPDGTSCTLGSGCYKGLLFFQDPDRSGGSALTPAGSISGNSCSNHSNCSYLDGGDNMELTGAAYLPQSVVDFKSNNTATSCIVIIAEAVIFSGNSSMNGANCTSDGVATVTSSSVALIQ